jgi:hypothetical protein
MQKTIAGITYDSDTATWVAKIGQGESLVSTIYQMPDNGPYFLLRGDVIEPITEFEVKRILHDIAERIGIEEAVGEVEQMFAQLGRQRRCRHQSSGH